jgi:hypothetical protein
MNDWRTDNWAGRRDPASNPNNHRFPRSAREAGFYYGPTEDDEGPVWPMYVALAIIIGLIYWLG